MKDTCNCAECSGGCMGEKEMLQYTKNKVEELFKNYPVHAHGIDHVKHVRDWAVKIAKAEKADEFLCEMAAWLHDVGRTREVEKDGASNTHHEWSYQICQQWFREDPILSRLSKKDKEVILYAVRYHWNNAADRYLEAVILRDADKMDIFGERGVKRIKDYWGTVDQAKLEFGCRLSIEGALWFGTKTAKRIFEKEKMIEPVKKLYLGLLKKRISKIEF